MSRKQGTLLANVLALAILLTGLLTLSLCPRVAKADGSPTRRLKILYNPYGYVNWSTYGQYKAQLHCHSNQSDGNMGPEGVIDAYSASGFKILSITDHDGPTGVYSADTTWPWSLWGRDTSTAGMIAIEGNELTEAGRHHISAYYGSFRSSSSTDEDAWLSDIDSHNGLAILSHPYYHTITSVPSLPKSLSWYKNLLMNHPSLLGLEVFNYHVSALYSSDYDINLWDAILTDIADTGRVWGSGVDDAHLCPSDVGLGWNVVIVDKLTNANVKAAFQGGQFYCSSKSDLTDSCPSVESVVVDEASGMMSVEASNYTGIQWIADGAVTGTGTSIRYVDNNAINKYVRIALRNGTAWTCLQPITFTVDTALPSEPAGADNEGADNTTTTERTGTTPDKDMDTTPAANPAGGTNWLFVAIVVTAGVLVTGMSLAVVLRASNPRWFRGNR